MQKRSWTIEIPEAAKWYHGGLGDINHLLPYVIEENSTTNFKFNLTKLPLRVDNIWSHCVSEVEDVRSTSVEELIKSIQSNIQDHFGMHTVHTAVHTQSTLWYTHSRHCSIHTINTAVHTQFTLWHTHSPHCSIHTVHTALHTQSTLQYTAHSSIQYHCHTPHSPQFGVNGMLFTSFLPGRNGSWASSWQESMYQVWGWIGWPAALLHLSLLPTHNCPPHLAVDSPLLWSPTCVAATDRLWLAHHQNTATPVLYSK